MFAMDFVAQLSGEELDPKAISTYKACLGISNILVGLHAAVVVATKTDYTIIVKWLFPDHAAPAAVTWTKPDVDGKAITRFFNRGETPITIPRHHFK
jgi:hypothetical protein